MYTTFWIVTITKEIQVKHIFLSDFLVPGSSDYAYAQATALVKAKTEKFRYLLCEKQFKADDTGDDDGLLGGNGNWFDFYGANTPSEIRSFKDIGSFNIFDLLTEKFVDLSELPQGNVAQ